MYVSAKTVYETANYFAPELSDIAFASGYLSYSSSSVGSVWISFSLTLRGMEALPISTGSVV